MDTARWRESETGMVDLVRCWQEPGKLRSSEFTRKQDVILTWIFLTIYRHAFHSKSDSARSLFPGLMLEYSMSKRSTASFSRRMPDSITEELVAVLSSKSSFEFKPLFEIILRKLRDRNAASGGEEMLRLRAYEKLQGLVNQGAVSRTVTGITKKYKGVAVRLASLKAEMKLLRAEWNRARPRQGCGKSLIFHALFASVRRRPLPR